MSTQAKLDWFDATRKRLQQFVDLGGELESDYGVRLMSAFLQSLRDLAEDLSPAASLEEELETAGAGR